MGFFEDIADEFKKAKPPEKALIAGAGIAVVGIAWYLHTKNSSSASPVQSSGSTTGSPLPQQGLQIFPYGSTPILGSNGQPVAVIAPPTTNQNPTNNPVNNPIVAQPPAMVSGGPISQTGQNIPINSYNPSTQAIPLAKMQTTQLASTYAARRP